MRCDSNGIDVASPFSCFFKLTEFKILGEMISVMTC
jgi:hypothetical protein